jgi:hypothetical protein
MFSVQKKVKSNTYDKRIEGIPAGMATSQIHTSALKNFSALPSKTLFLLSLKLGFQMPANLELTKENKL